MNLIGTMRILFQYTKIFQDWREFKMLKLTWFTRRKISVFYCRLQRSWKIP